LIGWRDADTGVDHLQRNPRPARVRRPTHEIWILGRVTPQRRIDCGADETRAQGDAT
jgi:hypothetical protein